MRIRFLTSVATAGQAWQEDEIDDVPDKEARAWIKAGVAEPVPAAKPKKEKASHAE